MATDRGAKTFKGSLGFVITDVEHRVLIFCYGCTTGHDPFSFQIQASAFLAPLRVVLLIAEYYKEETTRLLATNKEITLATDSHSRVNNLDAMQKYTTADLKCAMDPEWDLLQVMHIVIDKTKERPELKWVHMHQDDNPEEHISKLSEAA